MKLVVHVCCAPCLAGTLEPFRRIGDVFAYFYNPNIHPLIEFRKRLKAFDTFVERERVPAAAHRDYGLVPFLERVRPDGSGRCPICYADRLGRTARFAAEQGAEAFSTTLTSSTHQNHDQIRQAGDAAAAEAGVEFVYRDLRDHAAEGQAIARRLSLYRQQYCGCIFSEYERYKDTRVEMHRTAQRA
jgi:hypothetical protein